MKILVMNCGSSSLKYQLIDMDNESVLAKGLCERIGIDGSKLTHQPAGKDKVVVEKDMPTHQTAVELVLAALLAVLGLIGLVWFLLKKNAETNAMTRLFFVVILVTVLVSYYLFCFQFPHVCTENIRYCMVVIPILSLGLGYGVQQLGSIMQNNK